MLSFNVLDDLIESKSVLENFIKQDDTKALIEKAIAICVDSINNQGKIISAGNGGSMCDAMHFAEELSGRYRNDRQALPAVCICDPSHLTCVGNDYGFDSVFSRFIEGLGFNQDVFLGISTSGNSKNIIKAVEAARTRGMKSICLLGKDGGTLKDLCDVSIVVPHSGYADRIQEVHTIIIHIMIKAIESLVCNKS